jgi:hypothetical protein
MPCGPRWTDVSEDRTASIFRFEELTKQVTKRKQRVTCSLLLTGFMLDLHFEIEDGHDMFFWNNSALHALAQHNRDGSEINIINK